MIKITKNYKIMVLLSLNTVYFFCEGSRFTFVENTISNSPNASRTKFLGSDGFFCFCSICKFGSFKNPFATILPTCLTYTLDLEDLFCWCKWKKMISMNCGSSTICWIPWRWVRLDLMLTVRNIYINFNLNPLTKFSNSSKSTEFRYPPTEHL